MTIIIKLTGLPNSASSLDIRRFFSGLSIPDGGVHVIGGEEQAAFIAFANDEDARQAMTKDELSIKGSKIRLFLSSKSQMKSVIDKARNQNLDSNKSSTISSNNTSINQQPQSQKINGPTALGNGSQNKISNSLNNLTSNLSKNKLDTKISSSTSLNQINYGSLSNNSSLVVTNLQEAPDYRRARSPNDRVTSTSILNTNNQLNNLSNDPLNDQRVKQLLDQVKNIPNSNLANTNQLNTVNAPLRSRLGGFDLSTNEEIYSNNLINTNGINSTAPLLITPSSTQQHFNNKAFFDTIPSTASQNLPNLTHSITDIYPLSKKYVLECRGLPPNVEINDIQGFFRKGGVLIDRDQIKLSMDRGFVLAHLVITSDHDLCNALSLNHHLMGNFPIEIQQLNLDPLNNTRALLDTPLNLQPPINNHQEIMGRLDLFTNNNQFENSSFSRLDKELYPLFMKGIPYDLCIEREVKNFFEPISIYEIVFTKDRSGRLSGNAYVIFETKNLFDLAMKRDKKYMQRRYIELFEVSMEEVERYKFKLSNKYDESESGPYSRKRKRDSSLERSPINDQLPYCCQIFGLPPTFSNQDISSYFMQFGSQPIAVHIMLKQNGMNAGECFVEFLDRQSLDIALRQNGQRIGNYHLSIKEVSYHKVCKVVKLPKPSSHFEPRGSGKFSKQTDYHRDQRDHLDRRGDRRSTLYCRVSNKAKMDDIISFFQDFKIRPNQIEYKYKADRSTNKRCDEIYIKLNSPRDVERAIKNLNKKFFIDKYIYLNYA